MMEHNENKIKAILFDSGRVLNRPATGHWFIPPGFFTYVDERTFNSISAFNKDKAFNKAHDYIVKQHLILNEDEEYKHFIEYYMIFSNILPQLQLNDKDVQGIAKNMVYNYDKYIFFNDVFTIIPMLSRKYKLAVVSDAWPSLEGVFRKAKLRDYFSSFIISSVKGVTKPNGLMYKSALEELDVSPGEAIFIDDNIKNCDGARRIGINSFLLCRDWRLFIYHKLRNRSYNVIRNLNDIKKYLLQ